jgi:hypothetical protein
MAADLDLHAEPGNRPLHRHGRPEPDVAPLDPLVGFPNLVEPVRLRHDAHLAARGERERLVKVLAAVLLAADDLDPLRVTRSAKAGQS